MWPWELTKQDIDPCSGPSLFGALYRLFRSAYNGSSIKLDPIGTTYPLNLRHTFLTLPLDIQERLANQIWKGRNKFNNLKMWKCSPVLNLELRFLFILYGKHKHHTQSISKMGHGNWQGTKTSNHEYNFTYTIAPCRCRKLIPDLVEREPHLSINFTMLGL